jgi:hypothetical protein
VTFRVASALACIAGACAIAAPRISSYRIDAAGNRAGKLVVMIDGAGKEIAPAAFRAWIIDAGARIAYSTPGRVHGFEGEGDALHIYDAATAKTSEVMSAPFEITKVEEAYASNGRRALLATMSDSGLGASHVAVVDPARGQVFEAQQAKIMQRRGDRILVGFFRESDWERMSDSTPLQPFRVRTYDLKDLLRRPLLQRRGSTSQ